ncbi:MAG TPA: hypothetical protein VG318_04275 [Actinomycetota bacterium]|nr:hypothetical protein [Actinomycetota bacterium]
MASNVGVRRLGAAVVAMCCLAAPSSAHRAPSDAADITVVGVFGAGGVIRGAALENGYLYVATTNSLSVYDASNPSEPELLATRPTPRIIHGELISTGGELLLLNGGLVGGGLDVWNVEDKSNPVLAGSLEGIGDEHFSCLLECRWAYGSAGSVVDLRDPRMPDLSGVNWKVEIGIGESPVHRLDEYRTGFMATAPRGDPPLILDVRRPLQPRVVARTVTSRFHPSMFLYTTWPRGGDDRFVVTSTENGGCNDEHQGALVTFDTAGWPEDGRFEVAGRYRYRGRTDDENCLAYYFSLHPRFDDGGLILLPNGLEGTRLVEVAPDGTMKGLDSFVLPTSDVWLAFWVDEQIFYALNTTGEVYILRYS